MEFRPLGREGSCISVCSFKETGTWWAERQINTQLYFIFCILLHVRLRCQGTSKIQKTNIKIMAGTG